MLLTTDNLIFFSIVLVILVVFIIIFFLIIRAIFRFIISFFKKDPKAYTMEGALVDKGKDLGVYVDELEKSRVERSKTQPQQQAMAAMKPPIVENSRPIKQVQQESPVDKEKEYDQKMQKNIEAGLNKLKSKGGSNKSGVKTVIPVPERIEQEGIQDQGDVKLPKNLEQLAKARVLGEEFKQEQTGRVEKPILESQSNKALSQEIIASKKLAPKQKDTSFFHGRQGVKMGEATYEITKKTSPYLRGGGTYTLKERQEIAKKLSDKKFGTLLQKSDKARILSTLNKEKMRASPSERTKILKQERFIKNIFK